MSDKDTATKDLYVADCIRLEGIIRVCCSAGFSDRVVTNVLAVILIDSISRQNDPNGALDQLIGVLKEARPEGGNSAHNPEDL